MDFNDELLHESHRPELLHPFPGGLVREFHGVRVEVQRWNAVKLLTDFDSLAAHQVAELCLHLQVGGCGEHSSGSFQTDQTAARQHLKGVDFARPNIDDGLIIRSDDFLTQQFVELNARECVIAKVLRHRMRITNQFGVGDPERDIRELNHVLVLVLDDIYQEHALQHLDIKPANLLLFGRRLKVADFGLMKNLYERAASLVHGLTPTYAAPEIFEGRPTRTSDQYSLAVLYQEMLTGHLPFDGTTAARLAAQHLREAPALRYLPAAQQPVIARALSKDPQQRFASCLELIEELTAAVRQAASALTDVREESSRGHGQSLKPASSEFKLSRKNSDSQVRAQTQACDANDTRRPASPDMSRGEMPPTIVLGIGGTAAEALQRLRLRISDRLGDMESLPGFKMRHRARCR